MAEITIHGRDSDLNVVSIDGGEKQLLSDSELANWQKPKAGKAADPAPVAETQ